MKAAKPKIKEEPREPIQERAVPTVEVTGKGDGGSNFAPRQEADSKSSRRQEIEKQIADHEKWMSDHTDDARGVQERLQQIAVLQAKLVEMDQPKHETRVRQAQTV